MPYNDTVFKAELLSFYESLNGFLKFIGFKKEGPGFFALEIQQINLSIKVEALRSEIGALQEVLKQSDSPNRSL